MVAARRQRPADTAGGGLCVPRWRVRLPGDGSATVAVPGDGEQGHRASPAGAGGVHVLARTGLKACTARSRSWVGRHMRLCPLSYATLCLVGEKFAKKLL